MINFGPIGSYDPNREYNFFNSRPSGVAQINLFLASPFFFPLICLSLCFIIFKGLGLKMKAPSLSEDVIQKREAQLTVAYYVLTLAIIGFVANVYYGLLISLGIALLGVILIYFLLKLIYFLLELIAKIFP